jgi:hypothetical protein
MNRKLFAAWSAVAALAIAAFAVAEDMPGMPGMKMPATSAPASQPAAITPSTSADAIDLGNTVSIVVETDTPPPTPKTPLLQMRYTASAL